jgi:hypothetical protein
MVRVFGIPIDHFNCRESGEPLNIRYSPVQPFPYTIFCNMVIVSPRERVPLIPQIPQVAMLCPFTVGSAALLLV